MPTTVSCVLVTLGRFEVRIEDRIVPPPPTHKARALIALLVSNQGNDFARERLLEVFWKDSEPERAREGLRTALSSIRRALRAAQSEPGDVVVADKSVVRWVAATECDAARFERLASSGTVSDKRAAMRLYGGDFLEGTYEDWAVRERDRLAAVYESVLADLVTAAGDVDAARVLVSRDPYREEAYATLIDAAVEAGRLPAAAELVAQYRSALREIQAEPSPGFQKRFAGVPQHDAPRVRDPRAKSTGDDAARTQTNLPSQLTSFIGRDDDVAELRDFIRRSRLVTLVGAGGIGKTRLALAVAANPGLDFSDGIWFVDFAGIAGISDAEYVVSAIASVLTIPTTSLPGTLQERLVAAARKRQLLLVLDNCEHVLWAVAPLVFALLQNCAEIRIIATSREPLGIGGEDVVRPAPLSRRDAVDLFIERARAADKRFARGDRVEETVAAICRRLDGIPLAIELAAARTSVLSLKHLERKLNEHFGILNSKDATRLPRHQTVRALVDWSYDLLSPHERTMLGITGVFARSFTLESAAAVCGDALDAENVLEVLASLVAKSLVHVDTVPERERYTLLQIMQQYAHEKLVEAGELPRVSERHARYFLNLMLEADRSYGSTNAREWSLRYGPEIDNVRAAIDYGLAHGDALCAAASIASARELWQERGLYAEGMQRGEQALEALGKSAPETLRGELWLLVAQLGNVIRQTTPTLEAARCAVDVFDRLGDAYHLSFALQTLGFSLIWSGAHAEAESTLLRAQTLCERLANRRVISRILLRRGHNATVMGEPERALGLYERSLQLMRALEDEHFEGFVLGHMANVHFHMRESRLAIEYGCAALRIFRRLKDAAKESSALTNLAESYFELNEFANAKENARLAIARAVESENRVSALLATQHLAAIAAVEGASHTAARLLGYVDSAYVRLGLKREYGETYTRDRALASLRERLSDAEIARLMEEGATVSDDEAFALATTGSGGLATSVRL